MGEIKGSRLLSQLLDSVLVVDEAITEDTAAFMVPKTDNLLLLFVDLTGA